MLNTVTPVARSLNGGADEHRRVLDIVIDPPIEWNNTSYDTLHLEEPTAHMVERAESELGGVMTAHTLRKYQIALVSQASGLPRQVVERMRISQVRQAHVFLQAFVGGGPPIGEI